MASSDFKLTFGVDITELLTGIQAATDAVTASAEEMKTALESVQSGFALVGEAVIALTAIMEGGRAFKDMIDATVNLNTGSRDLGKQFGVSATQASVLKVALGESLVTQEEFSAAGTKLERQLKTNEGAFNSVGIATRDATTGGFRPLLDIMLDVNKYLSTLKEGTDRGVESARLYGKGFEVISGVMRLTDDAIGHAAGTARDLNLLVTSESLDATKQYQVAMDGLHNVFEGIKNAIGQALMPVLTDLANWFRANGPAAIENTKIAMATLGTVFLTVKEKMEEWFHAFEADIISLGNFSSHISDFVNDVNSLHWGNAGADLKDWVTQQHGIYQEYLNKNTASAAEAAKDNEAMLAKMFDPQHASAATTGTDTEGPPIEKLNTALQKRLEAVIHEMEREYAEIEKSHDNDIRLMEEQSAVYAKNAAKRIEIAQQEVASETVAYGAGSQQAIAAQKRLDEARAQGATQLKQLTDIVLGYEEKAQLAEISNEQKMLDEKYKAHEISASKLEEGQLALEQRLTNIQEAEIRKRMALIDPQHDPVELAKLALELENIETQHQQRMTDIQRQAQQNNLKQYDTLFKGMQNGFSTAISNILKGTATLQQGLQQMVKAVLDSIIDFLAQWVTKWAATQLTNLIASKTTAAAQVTTQAAVAGASGTASFSGAPWPVDLGAPAFGATMFAAAEAYTPAAEGGYDIPRGLNPLTQLHEREMVLPAPFADVIRALADRPSAAAGGTSAKELAMIGKSVERGMMRNANQISRNMQRLHGQVRV
jgi:hypothetical protein